MNDNIDATFFKNRLEELRKKKGVSRCQVSKAMGRSRNYIHNIVAGNGFPSMTEFFAICEYFEVSPQDFFDSGMKSPLLISEITGKIRNFNAPALSLVLSIVNSIEDCEIVPSANSL
jgi:transcriptional regulator with XRE-family HTH domain